MSKKDYIIIANTLSDVFNANAYCLDNATDKLSVVFAFINALEKENPRFDAKRFVTACLDTEDIKELSDEDAEGHATFKDIMNA